MVKHIIQIVFILVAVQLTMMAAVWFISAGEASLNLFDWDSLGRIFYLSWSICLTSAGVVFLKLLN